MPFGRRSPVAPPARTGAHVPAYDAAVSSSRLIVFLAVSSVTPLGCADDDGGNDSTATGGVTSVSTTGSTTASTSTAGDTSATETSTKSTTDAESSGAASTDTGPLDTGSTEAGTTGGDSSYPPCDPDNPCDRGAICWTDGRTPPSSACGEACTGPDDCPAPEGGTAAPVCVEDTLDPGAAYCILDCETGACPTGMSCVPVGNSSYCLWPP
jgi:hypothetical protein